LRDKTDARRKAPRECICITGAKDMGRLDKIPDALLGALPEGCNALTLVCLTMLRCRVALRSTREISVSKVSK